MKYQLNIFFKSLKSSYKYIIFLFLIIILDYILLLINYTDSVIITAEYNAIITNINDINITNILYFIYYLFLTIYISVSFIIYERKHSYEFILLRENINSILVKKNIVLVLISILSSVVYYSIIYLLFSKYVSYDLNYLFLFILRNIIINALIILVYAVINRIEAKR